MTMPRLLVIGRSGQLAVSLAALKTEAASLVCRGREVFDLSSAASVRALVEAERPAAIINAAAYTAVDRAESEPDAAYAVNRDGPAHLAAVAAAKGIPLIHVSTDYVFDGTKTGRYREDDPTAPLGVYGASKAAGEAVIRERQVAHVILRTSWVHSPYGANFVRTMLRLGGERPELAIVADQIGLPTYAPDLAEGVLGIALAVVAGKSDGFGTFHLAGGGEPVSWYGFAQAIFQRAAERGAPLPCLRPIPASEYPLPARRPANSVLDCARMAAVYGVALRPWPDALDDGIRALLLS